MMRAASAAAIRSSAFFGARYSLVRRALLRAPPCCQRECTADALGLRAAASASARRVSAGHDGCGHGEGAADDAHPIDIDTLARAMPECPAGAQPPVIAPLFNGTGNAQQPCSTAPRSFPHFPVFCGTWRAVSHRMGKTNRVFQVNASGRPNGDAPPSPPPAVFRLYYKAMLSGSAPCPPALASVDCSAAISSGTRSSGIANPPP